MPAYSPHTDFDLPAAAAAMKENWDRGEVQPDSLYSRQERLEATLALLDEALERLEVKLAPVLISAPAEPPSDGSAKSPVAVPGSQLAGFLSATNRKVSALVRRVGQLADCVDL